MTRKETWMHPGNTVKISTGKGVITGLIESEIGPSVIKQFCNCTHGVRVVLKLFIRPEGVGQSYTYNPMNVSEYKHHPSPS